MGPGVKQVGDRVSSKSAGASRGVALTDLVEVMNDAVDRVEDWAVRVILSAAVLVHQVKLGSILKRLPAELVARVARPVQARRVGMLRVGPAPLLDDMGYPIPEARHGLAIPEASLCGRDDRQHLMSFLGE